ncbi:Uronyl 2-sulfotransferase [Liparis tanakae]|uniref:Uronyl 2-sulfotransferase n=1 Tax=Liparis tanakae TaxID=230148 RepID=A0A4Z2HK93_9TELE|nr:Uronyl 2-sulfotransferase [Liparis tanakae]
MMKNFSSSPLHSNGQTPNHVRERNNRKYSALSAIPLRFSLRGYGFCMATLFLFCFGSLFYQLNGGPPKILLDIRQYLGKNFLVFLCWQKRVIINAILVNTRCTETSRSPALISLQKSVSTTKKGNSGGSHLSFTAGQTALSRNEPEIDEWDSLPGEAGTEGKLQRTRIGSAEESGGVVIVVLMS